MEFIKWLLQNFGFVFGSLFLLYGYLITRRLVALYELLRYVPAGEGATCESDIGKTEALHFLEYLYLRLEKIVTKGLQGSDAVIDAIWSEVDCRVTVHFAALQGYVNTLILVGFAGTIFGSIGAFSEMIAGLANKAGATSVMASAWENGLATALYSSLAAAGVGAVVISLIGSRMMMTRAKRLETLVSLRVSEILANDMAKDITKQQGLTYGTPT